MIPIRTVQLHSPAAPVRKPQLSCYTRKHCEACTLCDAHTAQYGESGKHRVLRKGEKLFQQGDSFQSVFVVQSGSIKAYMVADDGEEQITGFHFPGELLSADGVGSGRQPYTAEALETTSICEFTFKDFERLGKSAPEVEYELMRAMGTELSREKKRMMVLGRMRAEQRLANFILDTAREMRSRGQARDDFTFSMSRQDIANYLGLAVETVSRLLTHFATSNLIRVQRRKLQVLDADSLCDLAQGFQTQAPIARTA